MVDACWFVEKQIICGEGPYYQRRKNKKVELVFAHCNHIICNKKHKNSIKNATFTATKITHSSWHVLLAQADQPYYVIKYIKLIVNFEFRGQLVTAWKMVNYTVDVKQEVEQSQPALRSRRLN
jgi:hypothetical protein